MSDNWVVQNLQNALETWNEKLAEIWTLVTQSPQAFKGGSIWRVMVSIHGAVQAVGLALVVLFFVVGVMKTCGSFADLKRPEAAIKVFIRFVLAKTAVTYGLELMNALFSIAQGLVTTIMSAAGFGAAQEIILPTEIITAVEDCGFLESIPLWAVTLIGGLLITVLSIVMIMTVYGRFFKLYLYTAIAPVPLSAFAGEPTQSIGLAFIKSYAAVCLEGAIIVHDLNQDCCFSFEDLKQIGAIGLCKAAATDKGGCFSTYAYRLIWNEICDALIKSTRISKREQLREAGDIYRAVKENEPLEMFLACELQILMDQLRARASGTTAKGILCLELSSEGYTSSEIAALVGAKPGTVRLWMTKGRRFLLEQPEFKDYLEVNK